MRRTGILLITIIVMGVGMMSCSFSREGKLLVAPSGTNPLAARHNAEGLQAYDQGQVQAAKPHFEAAIQASPTFTEAHYNLGMVLYRMGAEGEARPHFMKAADLAPGNDVIWSSPALSGVAAPPTKSFSGSATSDGHGHSH